MTIFQVMLGLVVIACWVAITAEAVYLGKIARRKDELYERRKTARPRQPMRQGVAAREVSTLFVQGAIAKREAMRDVYDDLSAADNLTKAREGYLAKLKREIDDE